MLKLDVQARRAHVPPERVEQIGLRGAALLGYGDPGERQDAVWGDAAAESVELADVVLHAGLEIGPRRQRHGERDAQAGDGADYVSRPWPAS